MKRCEAPTADPAQGMSKAMSGMCDYIVMAFFAALFTADVVRSNLGALVRTERGDVAPGAATARTADYRRHHHVTAMVNVLIRPRRRSERCSRRSSPILMQVGLAPELTQAAYRVGDSTTNIITPLMPYFPLVA